MENKPPFCNHSDITDMGICKSCGVDVTSKEFIDSLPEDSNYLGDLMGIIQLAQATAKEYLKRSTDSKPKFFWVGTQLMRITSEMIWDDILKPSFIVAKELGYRGDHDRWASVCKDYIEIINNNPLNFSSES